MGYLIEHRQIGRAEIEVILEGMAVNVLLWTSLSCTIHNYKNILPGSKLMNLLCEQNKVCRKGAMNNIGLVLISQTLKLVILECDELFLLFLFFKIFCSA